MVAHRRGKRGFTLVELLVVIGIIALLIGILLPTLGSVRRSARSTQCQATMRNIGQAVMLYAGEFKGTLPPALYVVNAMSASGPQSVGEDPNTAVHVWWSLLRKYFRGGRANWDNAAQTQDERFMAAYFCAEGQNRDAGNDYIANPSLFVYLNLESALRQGGANFAVLSVKTNSLTSDVAMLWDGTEIGPNFNTQYIHGYDTAGGWVGGVDFIQQTEGAIRYRGIVPADDPDISDAEVIDPGANRDISNSATGLQGQIRWRHGRNDTANFVFGDGSVRSVKMPVRRGNEWSGELTLRNFRPKPPAGFSASTRVN